MHSEARQIFSESLVSVWDSLVAKKVCFKAANTSFIEFFQLIQFSRSEEEENNFYFHSTLT